MIAFFLSNISAKYYKNPTMLSRVIAKNAGDVFLDTMYFGVNPKLRTTKFSLRNLETLLSHTVLIYRQTIISFRHNARVWQTDRQMDRIAIAIACVEEDEEDDGDDDVFIKQVYTHVQGERKK